MNYQESQIILELVKKSKRILLSCHRNPDPDSIGCVLALYEIIKTMNILADIVCPSAQLFDSVNYLKGYGDIQRKVDFSLFDFSKYDLFVTLDSSSWDMITGDKDFKKPNIKIVVIDHHNTNTSYGDINIINDQITSVAEMLYLIIQDWKIEINDIIATCLLTGIIGDTGAFRYPKSTSETFRIAADLMDKGADKDQIIQHIYRNEPFSLIKFYGEALDRIVLDKENRFVWTVVPYDIYKKLDAPTTAKESTASLFAQVVENTDFGFVIVEQEPNNISVSFRSRTGFDTSVIAKELGGGGHVYASGVTIEGLNFEEAVKKVVDTALKYARNKINKYT